jgi:membrane protease subunit HflK
MNRRLNSFFGRDGGGGSGSGGPGNGGGPSLKGALIGLLLLTLIGLAIWAVSGVYIIREGESSIELKFGKFSEQKDRAGLTWRSNCVPSKSATVESCGTKISMNH